MGQCVAKNCFKAPSMTPKVFAPRDEKTGTRTIKVIDKNCLVSTMAPDMTFQTAETMKAMLANNPEALATLEAVQHVLLSVLLIQSLYRARLATRRTLTVASTHPNFAFFGYNFNFGPTFDESSGQESNARNPYATFLAYLRHRLRALAAAYTIQRALTASHARRTFFRLRSAAITLQSALRGAAARKLVQHLRLRRQAAIRIQAFIRASTARKMLNHLCLLRLHAAAITIQSLLRARLARRALQQLRLRYEAASVIQRALRASAARWLARGLHLARRRHTAATTIQAMATTFLARLQDARQLQAARRIDQAVLTLQRFYRRVIKPFACARRTNWLPLPLGHAPFIPITYAEEKDDGSVASSRSSTTGGRGNYLSSEEQRAKEVRRKEQNHVKNQRRSERRRLNKLKHEEATKAAALAKALDVPVVEMAASGRQARGAQVNSVRRGRGGNGNGYGNGYGNVYGNGYGNGYGDRYGQDNGYGNAYGNAPGNGYGQGNGNGTGFGRPAYAPSGPSTRNNNEGAHQVALKLWENTMQGPTRPVIEQRASNGRVTLADGQVNTMRR